MTTPRLSLATLPSLPQTVQPRIDPRGLRVGIVHLGMGAFHRAHQAVYTEDAIAAAGGDWGICGVTERSADVIDQLAPQDGLYTLAQRGADGERLRVIAAIRRATLGPGGPRSPAGRIAGPATHSSPRRSVRRAIGMTRPPTTCGPRRSGDRRRSGGRRPRTVIGQLASAWTAAVATAAPRSPSSAATTCPTTAGCSGRSSATSPRGCPTPRPCSAGWRPACASPARWSTGSRRPRPMPTAPPSRPRWGSPTTAWSSPSRSASG